MKPYTSHLFGENAVAAVEHENETVKCNGRDARCPSGRARRPRRAAVNWQDVPVGEGRNLLRPNYYNILVYITGIRRILRILLANGEEN